MRPARRIAAIPIGVGGGVVGELAVQNGLLVLLEHLEHVFDAAGHVDALQQTLRHRQRQRERERGGRVPLGQREREEEMYRECR